MLLLSTFFASLSLSLLLLSSLVSSRLVFQHVCIALKHLILTNDWNPTPSKNKISNLAYNQIYNLKQIVTILDNLICLHFCLFSFSSSSFSTSSYCYSSSSTSSQRKGKEEEAQEEKEEEGFFSKKSQAAQTQFWFSYPFLVLYRQGYKKG